MTFNSESNFQVEFYFTNNAMYPQYMELLDHMKSLRHNLTIAIFFWNCFTDLTIIYSNCIKNNSFSPKF